MIPINTNKIVKNNNSYMVTDYVDYLMINTTSSDVLSSISKITTYNGKMEILDQIDGTFINIWLNTQSSQQTVDSLLEPPIVIIPIYFLSMYNCIEFDFVSDSLICNFYKDQTKIKRPEQIYIDKFRKTFRIIYNNSPISNKLVINLNFNIYPQELIWKYFDKSSLPELVQISSDIQHINNKYDIFFEQIGSALTNTKYYTIIQPLLHHNSQNLNPTVAFYSFGANPTSYKLLSENTTQFPINNICINNDYIPKVNPIKVYIIGMTEL